TQTTQTPTPTPSTTPTPTPTPTPTTPTPSTTPSEQQGCSAAYKVSSSWNGGFVADVIVTAGVGPINEWKVVLLLPTGSRITSLWGATTNQSTGAVSVTNAAYNGSLGAGKSTTFGFQGSGSGEGVTATCSAD
ncbi:MAG: hypothetical protein QG608_3429, partial [Actinomycetota bacterium]|nr:hypothetical protein [Actinomycetota bacterium]